MSDDDLYRSRLIAAMERHGMNTPKHREAKSHIVYSKSPINGLHVEQRVRGNPIECITWALQNNLVGPGFKIGPDIYDESYSRNW